MIDKTKDPKKAEQFGSYMQGFRHGAAAKMMDPAFTKSAQAHIQAAYDLGYTDGTRARVGAAKYAAVKYDHTPTVLRVA